MENSNTQRKSFLEIRKPRLIPAILLAVSIPLMLFIVSPLEIYKNGAEEFTFGLADFIWVLLLLFFVFALINFVVLFLVPKTAYKVIYSLFLATLLLLFLQINFLNINLTSLAGDDNGKTQVATSTFVINTIVWILIEGGFVALFFLVKKRDIKALICIMLSFALFASQLVNLVIVSAGVSGRNKNAFERLAEQDENFVPTFLTQKNLTTLSENKNIVVFCIDRFDSELYANPSLTGEYKDKYKSFYESLNGFTYYSDNISMYARTYPSVCYMLTNIENTVDTIPSGNNKGATDRKNYLNYAYNNNKTLSYLDEKGYQINLYTDTFYGFDNAYYLPSYINNTETTTIENVKSSIATLEKFQLGLNLTKISLYRALPYALKDVFGSVTSDTCNEVVKINAEDGILENSEYTTDMKNLFNKFTSKDSFDTIAQNKFSFIHFSGCHNVPYDENWESTGNISDSAGDVFVSLNNSFKIITAYINQMKKLGVYDNATIIITGDHSNISNKSGAIDGNYVNLDHERMTALFVKPSGATEGNPLTNVCDNQVSHEDLWKTIFASENITGYDSSITGCVAWDKEQTDKRTRHYYFHRWDDALHSCYTELYYTISGKGSDFIKNWKLDDSKTKSFGRGYYD